MSFHYLCRSVRRKSGEVDNIPFSQAEFENLFAEILRQPTINLEDEEAADRLRFRIEVPLENVQRIDSRTICGTFRASYWGHAYDNTARGRIPADSISLRPFHFLLYLSDNGRIYIGSQYLGQFGGYSGLQRTICSLLGRPETIVSHSLRLGGSYYTKAAAKEIRVTFCQRPGSIAARNRLTSGGMVTFKKAEKDDGFEKEVDKRLLSFMGRPQSIVKRAVADLLNESELLDVEDSDIEDCTIIANINGKRKTIYLLDSGSFASRLPISAPLDIDGHPKPEETRKEMIRLLRDEVIEKS